ncbi:MAG TPA: VanZ family protein [Candidatus Limnocylindria bacterium]|jgi:glycopeptide antibiotics resistance protein|nr:VanZ family protein [Candidatus Limnocylindria bacterium]
MRWMAGIVLALWIAMGLLLTLQPVHPAPGQVVSDNGIPFRTIAIYLANGESPFWVRQFAGNLFLLLPVGLLGPMVVPALNGWLRLFTVALAMSLAIEVAQLWIPNRSADVDDVMLNVAGGMLGYAIFTLFRLGSRRPSPVADGR